MRLWDIYYYATLPLRILFVLIALLFIDDGDFPPIVRDGEYYWYLPKTIPNTTQEDSK